MGGRGEARGRDGVVSVAWWSGSVGVAGTTGDEQAADRERMALADGWS